MCQKQTPSAATRIMPPGSAPRGSRHLRALQAAGRNRRRVITQLILLCLPVSSPVFSPRLLPEGARADGVHERAEDEQPDLRGKITDEKSPFSTVTTLLGNEDSIETQLLCHVEKNFQKSSQQRREASRGFPHRVIEGDVEREAHPAARGAEERLHQRREDEDDVEENCLLGVEADVAGELRGVVHDEEVDGEEARNGGEGDVVVELRGRERDGNRASVN